MSIDPWGNEIEDGGSGYSGIFAIRKLLDGEKISDFVDKHRFIGIKIAEEEFLLSVDQIVEIIMLPRITFVPNSGRFIEGVMNLRGTILPVLNIRKMMGLAKTLASPSTRILICKDETQSKSSRVGIVVDGISRVVALGSQDIDLSAHVSVPSGQDLLAGVSKQDDHIRAVLSLPKIIAAASDGKISGGDPEAPDEGTQDVA